VPDNTPEQLSTPQLGRHTDPMPVQLDDDSISMLTSAIDYDKPASPKEGPPMGFIYNNANSCHYYPVYVPNNLFGTWDEQDRTKVAKYIQYNADYMMVTGTDGEDCPQRTIPVYISRKAQHFTTMTSAMWREFKHGAPQEFMVNEAIADMADPCIIGKVNRFCGKQETKEVLDKIKWDARHWVDEVVKERLIVKQDLVDTMAQIERANLRALIKDQLTRSFPAPPISYHTPELLPLEP
jgi:hypothetical protein